MKSITAILIDDEISALKGLQQKVSKLFPAIQILNTFQQPEKAIDFLSTTSPDIVFLDIQMPRFTGFELLSELKTIDFQLIFVTAYNEFALEALKASAIDYLLKPIDETDLKSAISKAIDKIQQKQGALQQSKLIELLTQTITQNNKIIIPTGKGISFIPYEEILHVEGYDGYTKFHLINDEVITSSYNLGKFEKKLPPLFFKTHKSHIINIQKVRAFENEGYIVLDNNYRVPISRTYKKVFLGLFK